jgi:16S rRNA (cytidine1402-2'-O)-methyltransferase
MAEVWGDREAFLCREATKSHEEYARGRILEIRKGLAARKAIRGEIVLVVAGATDAPHVPEDEPEALYTRLAAEGRTRREAVKEAARRLGLPARHVYRLVLEAEKTEHED